MSRPRKAWKISSNYLELKAIVYVRQSTLKQVRHNQESQRLQYELKERATALGIKRVEVIDKDLGYQCRFSCSAKTQVTAPLRRSPLSKAAS